MWSIFIEWFIEKYADRLTKRQQAILQAKYPGEEDLVSNRILKQQPLYKKKCYSESTIYAEVKSICARLLEEEDRPDSRKNEPGKNENDLQSFLEKAFASDEFKEYYERLRRKKPRRNPLEKDPDEEALRNIQESPSDRSPQPQSPSSIDLPREKAVWDMLLNLAINATDSFGIIYPPNIPKMGMGGDYSKQQQQRIQTKISKEKYVLLEIPEGLKGYLIVLDDHSSSDDIFLLAPSHWLENSQIDGKPIQLPKPATPDYRGIQLKTLGETNLWAGVFDTLPDWEWLQPIQEDLRRLDTSHLRQLLEYAENPQSNATALLRSSYTVVAN